MTKFSKQCQRFRDQLDALGLNQQGFALMIGRQPRTIRRWALDEVPVPTEITMLLDHMIDKQTGARSDEI